MTASAPAPPAVPADDGSVKTARWYAQEAARLGAAMLAELHETERVQTTCARCGASFDGPFREGRAWFAEHRREQHPEFP